LYRTSTREQRCCGNQAAPSEITGLDGSDLQNHLAALEFEGLDHHRNDIGLSNRLPCDRVFRRQYGATEARRLNSRWISGENRMKIGVYPHFSDRPQGAP
jgi:hypothetical protein